MDRNKKSYQRKDITAKLSLHAGYEVGDDLKLHNQQAKKPLEKMVPQIAKGAGITFFGDFFGKGVNFISQILIARLLGTELFGLYALGLVIFNVAQTLAGMGLSQGVVRYVAIHDGAGNPEKVKGTILLSVGLPFIVGSVIGLVLFLAADGIANNIGKPELSRVIKITSFGVPFMAAMMASIAATRGFKKMQYYVYVKNIFHPIANLALIVLFYWFGLRLLGAISAWIIAAGLGLILGIYYIKKEFPEFSKVKAAFEAKELLKFSGPLVLVGFLQMLFIRTDILMLGYFRTSAEVGVYNAVSQIMILLVMVLMAFNSIFSPMVADLYNRNQLNELNRLLKIVAKWVFLLTLPIFMIMVVSPKELLSIFGPEFVSGWPAFLILALFFFLTISLGPVTQTLIMAGLQKLELYNTLGSLLLNIILNLLLIPKFGLFGAAMATGISSLCLHVVRLLEIISFLKLSPFSAKNIKVLLLGIPVLGLSLFIKSFFPEMHYLQSLALTTLCVMTLYSLLFWLLGIEEEDRLVLTALKKKIAGLNLRHLA